MNVARRRGGRRPGRRALAAAVAGVAVGTGCGRLPGLPPARTPVERQGRHVLQIATGCGCHGADLAGWRKGEPDRLPRAFPHGERFVGADGKIPAPNITPDPETGIGRWSDAEIAQAIRNGLRPDGARLHPIMPYPALHGMAEGDLAALVTYLRRLRPVRNPVPERELAGALPEPGPLPPAPERPPEGRVELGKYLVSSVSLCGDCHSPRGPDGPLPGMLLAGSILELGPGQSVAGPNMTPDREKGIGRWSEGEIARYLRTGSRPDGGLAQSLMAGLIFTSFSHLTEAEAHAIAAYLKQIPPVRPSAAALGAWRLAGDVAQRLAARPAIEPRAKSQAPER
jgi:mono/diheme cytochrome c family protein